MIKSFAIKTSRNEFLKFALGDSAEQKVTQCHVLWEVEDPFARANKGVRIPIKKLPIGSLKNALGGIRTPDLLVRSQTLYPTGLQAQVIFNLFFYTISTIKKFQAKF